MANPLGLFRFPASARAHCDEIRDAGAHSRLVLDDRRGALPAATMFARSTAAFAPGPSSNGYAAALPWPERRPLLAAYGPGAAALPAAPADRAAVERGEFLGQLRPVWALAIAVAALIVGWAIVALRFPHAQLDIPAPRAQLGAEAAVASITFFCAVVLVLFVAEGVGQRRLRWVAGGFVIQAIGSAVFGYLMPLIDRSPNLNTAMYTTLLVLTYADVLFVIGLMPDAPPRFTARRFLVVVATFAVLATLVVRNGPRLGALVNADGAAITDGDLLTLRDLTPLHLLLMAVPLALAVAAAIAVAYHAPADGMGAWLVLAMVVYAGSHLHQVFWPATFHMNVTSSNALRLASAGILAIGGMIELKRAAGERVVLLRDEKEYSKRMAELASLRADFTAMVAHELDSPIAAIRAWADLLETDRMSPDIRAQGLEKIRVETKWLQGLVADVQAIETIDRDDFAVQPRPTSVVELLSIASDLSPALSGRHPLEVTIEARDDVRADPERIGQVLRNLLGNAAKYAPAGSPIELRATQDGAWVRIEVVDHGPGVAPGDEKRIFEKYQRGRVQPSGIGGAGLGLYLSRRILLSHGSDLTVERTAGGGATFSFTLEVVS